MANTTSNNFNVRNSSNFHIGQTTINELSQRNLKHDFSNDIYLKKKNILAAIDLNSDFSNKKRPYSANKPPHKLHINKQNPYNKNKPRSAKSKSKNYDNLDLGNFQNLKNINKEYYQKLIDKLINEYGNNSDIDEEILNAYLNKINYGNNSIDEDSKENLNANMKNKMSQNYNHDNQDIVYENSVGENNDEFFQEEQIENEEDNNEQISDIEQN